MLYIEGLEVRALFAAAAIPGDLSFTDPLPGQTVRIGSNPASNGAFLGWTSPRQTIHYSIEVADTGEYAVSLQDSTARNGVIVRLDVDGIDLTGPISIPNSHGWYNWQSTATAAPIELTAGPHDLALVIQKGSANFQTGIFSAVSFTAGATSGTSAVTGPAIPGTQSPAVPPPPISGNWTLAFDDEFSGNALGPNWVPHQYWNNGATIGEGVEESDPANVSVSNGALQLTARVDNSFGTGYTGALVQTGGIEGDSDQSTFSFKYGYAEASILIPAGTGLWPAFWMLPAGHNDNVGEIDVMEMYDANTRNVYGTVHKNGAQQQHLDATGTDLSAGWHTFAVDWEPNQITWYLDGTAYATTTNVNLIPTVPMFPIFDLAVGGRNNPVSSSDLPATMQVDYVRIWQKN